MWQSLSSSIDSYHLESDQIKSLRNWILSHILAELIDTVNFLQVTENLDELYDAFAKAIEVTPDLVRIDLEDKYNRAMSTKPHDLKEWIQSWVLVMGICQKNGLPAALSSRQWFPHLEQAISATMPAWPHAFITTHATAITNGTLTFDTVATDLRLQGRLLASDNFLRGSALMATTNYLGTTAPVYNQTPVKRKRVCDACERPDHALEGCFYVNKHLRPD